MSCSSAPLSPEQWQRFEEMYGIKLLQMYGMSEAGWLCANRHDKSKIGTVGLAALHQELEIVDAQGHPCPPDVEGEVTAGGPHVAIGYLRADGTIEPIRGKRIKSGDLACRDAEGFIRVVGRSKDFIIRGGVNIAPIEIDEILREGHAGVGRKRERQWSGYVRRWESTILKTGSADLPIGVNSGRETGATHVSRIHPWYPHAPSQR